MDLPSKMRIASVMSLIGGASLGELLGGGGSIELLQIARRMPPGG